MRGARPSDCDPAKLVGRDLDARAVGEVAHAQLAEAERVQRLLGPADARQLFGRDALAVRHARRQARQGGLVPVRQTQLAGGGADLRFAHAGLVQRAADLVLALGGGAGARAPVAQVVHVQAVQDVARAGLARPAARARCTGASCRSSSDRRDCWRSVRRRLRWCGRAGGAGRAPRPGGRRRRARSAPGWPRPPSPPAPRRPAPAARRPPPASSRRQPKTR